MNRLASEASPYLRQHAENPVDWYPWGKEALETAVQQDKPILLSVGYSSCHWCHVMAHESFEDEATAKIMNELFINVKVDREERPDIDAIYMEATQAISGQGGWPMTVFLTPNGQPFFAGTYFPKISQAGRPAFVDLLHAVADAWTNDRSDVEQQAANLTDAISARTTALPTGSDIYANGISWLDHAQSSFEAAYDKEWGGFGSAPKFPQTMALEFLLRRGIIEPVLNSLDAMASGGIYDHVGGGFHRYSVDAFWMVPHFEKMLYDQAQLVPLYVHAYQLTGEQRFAQVATETIEYVLRDLQAPQSGWYSSEDADSDGEEGAFYVWRVEDVPEEAHSWYGVTKSGNFEGSNILHRPTRGDLLRPDNIEIIRQKLFEKRQTRNRPGLDDKILTEWNAMFIVALAEAATALNKPEWLTKATQTAEFLTNNLRSENGRWMRSWHKTSGAQHLGYAADYAWLTRAFLALARATGESRWRQLAIETAEGLELFKDNEGGYFTTGVDAEELIVRPRELFDGALPSANSTAALALIELAAITGDDDFKKRAEKIVGLATEPIAHHPTAFANLLLALDLLVTGDTQTVIAGNHLDLVKEVHQSYFPRNALLWGEHDDSPIWEEKTDGAYVCRNQTCSMPVFGTNELRFLLTNS